MATTRTKPPHRAATFLLIGAFLCVVSLLPAGSVTAHTFTKTDGNDSPSRIDLRSTSLSHVSKGVVYKIQTYEKWIPRKLGSDSFFVIQLDKKRDRGYERCAFIFYASQLRGAMTNCGAKLIRRLRVAKPNGSTVKLTIPTAETGLVYRWSIASFWDGPAPCANGCVDFTPNRFPDILHDLKPPVVDLATTALHVWDQSATSDFTFPFKVSDADSGIESWRLQLRHEAGGSWTTIESGLTAGSQDVPVTGQAGRWTYAVVATDQQGNVRVKTRPVLVPLDDVDLDPGAFTGTTATIAHAGAFGGSYTEIDAQEGFSFTPDPDVPCRFTLIGPGTGTWIISVTNGGTSTSWFATDFPDEQRLTIVDIKCTSSTAIIVIVTHGGGFGIDGIVGPS